jgi:hypothetical protein
MRIFESLIPTTNSMSVEVVVQNVKLKGINII